MEERFKNYKRYLRDIGIKMPPEMWILLAVVLAVALAAISWLVLEILNFQEIVLVILAFILVLDLVLGYPYIKGVQRIEEIERNFSDALKQMSDVLRAGGTYESALREVASAEYGPLKEEMENVLRKLEEGENFENSLSALSQNINSRLVQRTIAIVIDSIRSGAGLADVLDDIADDIRDLYRISIERKTRTMLQTLFLVAAAAIISPFIFGMVSEIINFLINTTINTGIIKDVVVGGQVVSSAESIIQKAIDAKFIIVLFLEVYIFVEILASSVMIALMREGKASKSLIYFPVLLFIAFAIFFAARAGIGLILGGFTV